jgi:predicted nucleotidyltransferase
MISTDTLKEITRRLVEAYRPEQVILFGSYAWGEPDEESDLDLLIVLRQSDEPAYRRARLAYQVLQGTLTPVDVLVRTEEEIALERGLRASLLNKIVTEGRVLHG